MSAISFLERFLSARSRISFILDCGSFLNLKEEEACSPTEYANLLITLAGMFKSLASIVAPSDGYLLKIVSICSLENRGGIVLGSLWSPIEDQSVLFL